MCEVVEQFRRERATEVAIAHQFVALKAQGISWRQALKRLGQPVGWNTAKRLYKLAEK
jgi:hypothetical protein